MLHPCGLLGFVWPYADPISRVRFARKVVPGGGDIWMLDPAQSKSDGGTSGRFRPVGLPPMAAHRWSYLAQHGTTDQPVIRHRCDVQRVRQPRTPASRRPTRPTSQTPSATRHMDNSRQQRTTVLASNVMDTA